MDKFVVDLDQLLNDFEYSELTDQYNASNSTPVTKHSINNVFHSLNEYLNTSVEVPESNNKEDDYVDEVGKKHCSDDKLYVENNYNVVESKNDEELELKVNDDNVKDKLVVVGNNVDKSSDICNVNQSLDIDKNKLDNENIEINKNIEVVDYLDFKNDKKEVIENQNVLKKLIKTSEDKEETMENQVDKEIYKIEKDSTESKEKPIETYNIEESSDENKEETADNYIKDIAESSMSNKEHIESYKNEEEPTENYSINDNETKEETIENDIVIKEREETPEIKEDHTVKEVIDSIKPENPTPVGFKEVEVIDDEVNELLEELENDPELNKSETQQEIKEVVTRPQNLSLAEDNTDKHKEINLIGEPGSTPFNNVYVEDEISKQKDVDNESISSSTYSDTNSTASTEEIRDDNDVIQQIKVNTESNDAQTLNLDSGSNSRPSENDEKQWLGKEAPLWIPDSDTTSCLHCDMKFTVIKRRHHCRACGLVLCSKCCYLRFKLEYLDAEARVCNKCHDILNKDTNSCSSSDLSTPESGASPIRRKPNPNNPLEYCSTVSPLQQVSGASAVPLPAVMVPVGVLKRKGSNKGKSNKSVMFCDGIRPGSDLTNLDNDFNYNNTKTKKLEKSGTTASVGKINRNMPLIDSQSNSFIPKNESCLPPLVTINKNDVTYTDCQNVPTVVETLKNQQLTFALLLNLYVHVKIIDMNCCINKKAWCFSTEGLINVGQDEIVYIIELIDEEDFLPKHIFYHINSIYADAVKGTSIKELGTSLHNTSDFLNSKSHAGFVYIRPTFQCLENIIRPKEPFLIGILIHRWETPWAKLFPLRLILRLGAEYRYYPCPVISTRFRDSVFVEIGHTIINVLADFRNFSYTLPQINGLTIHMEDKNTTVTIPINRYDQVLKSLNNSSDHILAFSGCFSQEADSHLVCIQDTQSNDNCYSTHAINIQNKTRKVTGASFIVFNGALKSSSGLTAKSNIVEDGLMIQILPEHMQQIRDNLREMKNYTISCGCVNSVTDETVNIIWGANDTNFNIGVISPIDGMSLSGIPSIRVHNGKNHYGANGNRIIRWTEVFIIENGDDNPKNQDLDISKISESIAKATCDALLNYLDLLVTNNCHKIGIRTNLHAESVSYCAGSNSTKLPPIYMKSLDNELIPVLHRISSGNLGDGPVVLELIFRILNV